MKSAEIRKRFIEYFTNRSHKEVHSSSLVPENHPSLLFTNSGMVQFTPYFLGIKDPVSDFGSKRLCSVQKSLRTGDLDIVGKSKYHLAFFEMLGSWSIGDYGKKEAVHYAYDLLTNKSYGFGLDGKKFIPTVFAGNDEAPEDSETIEAWKLVGIPEERISRLPASENWWAPGPTGPCGPCTEILYDRGNDFGPEEKIPGMTDNPRYLEIWNAGVFMQFNRDEKGKLHELPVKSVDTGAGLERFAVLLQGVDSVYETDLFLPIVEKIRSMSELKLESGSELSALRRVSEHAKSSTMIMADGVYPSNKDQGYVLRRILRTAFNDFTFTLKVSAERLVEVIPLIFEMYYPFYPEMGEIDKVNEILLTELSAYKKISEKAVRFMKKNKDAFDIYQSTGASRELIEALSKEYGEAVDFSEFDEKFRKHQEKSREGAGGKFSGGLGDSSIETTKLHTATHLLHSALREVLGTGVRQMGSNITPERLRFDFSYDSRLSDEEIKKVESIVNTNISSSFPVESITLAKEEAENIGALHFFKEKYPENVKVYFIGNSLETAISKEFCGGPHVKNTFELGHFHILKEESVGEGVRRIKAVLG